MTVIEVDKEAAGSARATTSEQAARVVEHPNEENPVIAGCEYVYEVKSS